MKKISLLLVLLSGSTFCMSQVFPGYRASNRAGVNALFSNPANIADSRHRWDVSVFSLHASLGNSQGSFSLSNINDVFGDGVDSLFFGNSTNETDALVAVEFIGPSFMYSIDRKQSIAFSTRARVIGNIKDIDGNLILSIDDDLDDLPITLNSSNNQKVTANAWTEIAGSYARVLHEQGPHFLKGGATVKFLLGAANSFANIDNLKGTLDEDLLNDVYLTNASGRVAIGVSGVDFDDFESNDVFNSQGNGIGFDLGIVYEYRPQGEQAKKYNSKYKFRAGLALLDLGAVRYKPRADEFGDYTINVPSGSRWYPKDLDGRSVSEIKDYLDASPYFTNNAVDLSRYKSKLPTTMQLSADWSINKDFYAALEGQISITDREDIHSAFYYNAITVTPRYEGKRIGVYLPINYNELTSFNLGMAFRLGSVFLGSGSFLTALFDQSKQADFFFGVRFGGLKKNGKKED